MLTHRVVAGFPGSISISLSELFFSLCYFSAVFPEVFHTFVLQCEGLHEFFGMLVYILFW